jgi:hypothetical protein
MDILLINEHDHSAAAAAFLAAAEAAGYTPHMAYAEHASDLYPWRIGRLPCLARITDGVAVYQVTEVTDVATFTEEAP